MWFPVAGSEQVKAGEVYAAQVGDQELVLFRNGGGDICVLEDRCPHRRVPLSLGKVIDGQLRCAYHGWTFDGKDGHCVAIPNLDDAEHIPASLCATAFRTAEFAGFIYVAVAGEGAGDEEFPCYPPAGFHYEKIDSGCAVVSVSSQEYLAAMLDGPHILLAIRGINISDFYIGDVTREGGCLSVDRTAIWTLKAKPHEKLWGLSTLALRTQVCPDQSVVRLQLLDAGEEILLAAVIAVVPGKRGTSQLHWRCYYSPNYLRSAPRGVRLRAARGAPFDVFAAVNGQRLADLMAGPSVELTVSGSTEADSAPAERIVLSDVSEVETSPTTEENL
ncbi:Rieske (2Fe-2S) protein [Spongiibacter sp. KMU-166]|uniref:Rieske (2Fe-2S) protein n=1 Tax=Spongiibacter thalassae TaxID=2721624 RepID=A0ABX1GBV2_9GAMM|nr:Rieske (2Fe-2S) protein [Spongiibacter thalassae]NKI16421.1 Rieske (2Fe-2S) protein [Spongiibacter thalassae]